MTVQGLKSVAEHLWRHRERLAAQLADRLTLRKVIQTNDEALELVVAIRYVSHPASSCLRLRKQSDVPIPLHGHVNLTQLDSSTTCGLLTACFYIPGPRAPEKAMLCRGLPSSFHYVMFLTCPHL